jgi:protein-disulfide isomerase
MEEVRLTKKEKRLLKKEQKNQEEQQQVKMKSVKNIIYWGIGILLVVGVFWWVKGVVNTPTTTAPAPDLTQIAPSDHVQGATQSAKLLIEYSDFQCPACAAYFPLVKKLIEEHGSDLTFVYRHFPLPQHMNAKTAAYAAEAAGKQGKFFEMGDLLFTRQETWAADKNAESVFTDYAKELELDVEKFKTDMASDEVKSKVEGDSQSGYVARINQTPTFFFNGSKLDPGKSYEDFAKKLGLQ